MNHPNLSDNINHNIAQSEIEGGVFLADLPMGTVLSVRTRNTSYTIVKNQDGFVISGHPKYCPEPIKANIHGSTWGGSMLKVGFIGRGMHLEFSTDEYPRVTTSTIQDITEVQ